MFTRYATSRRISHIRRHRTRRGVASILAMMFLVLFGSLAAAMAVVAQSNLRTADAHMKVSRAMSAAETGLVFATRRLQSEGRRFVIEKGVVDAGYAEDLWLGTYSGGDGNVVVLDPTGYTVSTPPDGIVHALRDAHLADSHSFALPGDGSLPEIDEFGTLRTRPIALTPDAEEGPYFRLTYELLADEPFVRVTAQGFDRDVMRTLQMDFKVEKKIEYAVASPNRIMIGKNVRVEGPVGSLYGKDPQELATENGDPLVMQSDFLWLDDALDARILAFQDQVKQFDVDGDARLRPDHPTEALGLAGLAFLTDYNGDEYVDDWDLFMAHFDTNGDKKIVYDASLASAAGHGMLAEEFTIDDQLARLIDQALRDRDGDDEFTFNDTVYGYNDGVIDLNDQYAKVHGRLAFSVARNTWEVPHGDSYQSVVNGPIRTDNPDISPVAFEVDESDLREVTTAMLVDSYTWFDAKSASGLAFADQVAAQEASGGEVLLPGDAGHPGWEPVPFGSLGAYDYFERPIYRNMIFNNVRIPMGTNALFEDCTFIGVTFVEAEVDTDHENWNYAGAVEPITDPDTGTTTFQQRFPDLTSEFGATVVTDTRPYSNNIRFEECTFLGSLAGDTPLEYTHWRNKLQMTGNTRFYVDPDDEDLAEQSDAALLQALLGAIPPDEREELAKSSILMPGWSIDVGNFNNEVGADPADTPKIKLTGTIVAGILDIRGTADVHGTLLMTFRPVQDQGPLFYGGSPDAFNTTIGYFGPSDGDGEGKDLIDADFDGFGEITLRYDPDAKLPDGIPWPIRIAADPTTYVE